MTNFVDNCLGHCHHQMRIFNKYIYGLEYHKKVRTDSKGRWRAEFCKTPPPLISHCQHQPMQQLHSHSIKSALEKKVAAIGIRSERLRNLADKPFTESNAAPVYQSSGSEKFTRIEMTFVIDIWIWIYISQSR